MLLRRPRPLVLHTRSGGTRRRLIRSLPVPQQAGRAPRPLGAKCAAQESVSDPGGPLSLAPWSAGYFLPQLSLPGGMWAPRTPAGVRLSCQGLSVSSSLAEEWPPCPPVLETECPSPPSDGISIAPQSLSPLCLTVRAPLRVEAGRPLSDEATQGRKMDRIPALIYF